MQHAIRFATLVLLVLVGVVRADGPATAPTGEDAAVLDTFRAYNDAMTAGDEKTMLSLQKADTDAQKKMSAAGVQADLAIAKLKKATADAFGDVAAKRVGKAVNDISNDDLKDLTVKIKGDKGSVGMGPDGGIPMIKVDGKWMFDYTSPMPENQVTMLTERSAKNAARMNELSQAIADKKIATVDELLKKLGNDE